MFRLSIVLAAAALAMAASSAPAAGPDAREFAGTARTLATLKPGTPTSCIQLTRTRSSRYLDKDTIVYRESAARYYVNRTTSGCAFATDVTVITTTPSTQLCRGEPLRLVQQGSGVPRTSCILGDFVPYTR